MVSARSFLVPFKYSQTKSYMIEFSHQKIRIYTQGDENYVPILERNLTLAHNCERQLALNVNVIDDVDVGSWKLLETSPSVVYTLNSCYTYDDLWDSDEMCFKLQTIQNCDILYIFSENHPIMVLKRYGALDWRLEELELVGGPFENMNDSDIMLTASDVTGTVTVTSDADVFLSSDVGRLVRLRGVDDNKIWVAGLSVSTGDILASDNKYYRAVNSGTTGSKKPVHEEGIRSDGGVRFEYLHDGMGIVKITAYTSAREVTAKVLKRLPNAVTDGTLYWELGLINSAVNYPKCGAFFRNRFVFLMNTLKGPMVCLSKVGDYNNFADIEYGETTAEAAISVPVLNTEFNDGKWLFAGDVLFVGTGSAEFYIDTLSGSAALANDNIKIVQISSVGSKAIAPVNIGAHVFFVDSYGLSLRDLTYNYYNDGYDQVDISLLGKHLFLSQITAISYQETPHKILWCLTGDGHVAALTFSAEQEVVALSRHDFSGEVEHIAVIDDFLHATDTLWLSVKRQINGGIIRTIEYMENGMPLSLPQSVFSYDEEVKREQAEKAYILEQARYLDGAVLYVRLAQDTSTEISGLDHLEGEKVAIFADGAVCAPQYVLGGKVSIQSTDTMVLVGKEIKSQYIPQSFYIDDEYGSGIGQVQRINHVVMMLYLSGGGKIGSDENHLSDILYRNTDSRLGVAQELFSGNKNILFSGKTDKEGEAARILIENTSPLPMNILALVFHVN